MAGERKTKVMNPKNYERSSFDNWMWIDEEDYGTQRGTLLGRANRRKKEALKTQTNLGNVKQFRDLNQGQTSLGNPKGLRDLENNSGTVTKKAKDKLNQKAANSTTRDRLQEAFREKKRKQESERTKYAEKQKQR